MQFTTTCSTKSSGISAGGNLTPKQSRRCRASSTFPSLTDSGRMTPFPFLARFLKLPDEHATRIFVAAHIPRGLTETGQFGVRHFAQPFAEFEQFALTEVIVV